MFIVVLLGIGVDMLIVIVVIVMVVGVLLLFGVGVGGWIMYMVCDGDIVWDIVSKYCIDVCILICVNYLSDGGYLICVGVMLCVFGCVVVVVVFWVIM